MTSVLGLDLSTRVGWALFRDGAQPAFGTKVLPKAFNPDDYGARCGPLFEWLDVQLAEWRPEIVVMESPFLPMSAPRVGADEGDTRPRFVTSQHALRLQISLAAIIETVVYLANMEFKRTGEVARIKCQEVASSTAKVALAGTARLGEHRKRLMVVAAHERGWLVADDHQADAAACCLVMLESLGEM